MNRWIALTAIVLIASCDRAEAPVEAQTTPSAESVVDAAAEQGSEPSPPPETSPETANMDPHEALAELDHRTPVPLQPMMAWHQKQNMMDHLVAIQEINSGVAVEEWSKVEAAATRIGSSPQMRTMCEHMGKGADGFTELALEFHSRADTIAEAARAKDASAVMKATGHTLEACTSCHAAYRQDVVSASEWIRRTQ
jgi:uncharacterized protein involved in copper resistance